MTNVFDFATLQKSSAVAFGFGCTAAARQAKVLVAPQRCSSVSVSRRGKPSPTFLSEYYNS
jgi:hypothetical protein